MSQEEFYIGWQAKTPRLTAKWLSLGIIGLAGVVAGVAYLLASQQQPFNNARYDFQKITPVKGYYEAYPVPMLRVESPKGQWQSLILIGFGKAGPLDVLEHLKTQLGDPSEYLLELNTHVVAYNGISILEIRAEENQEVAHQRKSSAYRPPVVEQLGEIQLKGQIVDPKCYFGVMKPGYGKVHRSCAVRCIAGGIPPVLVINQGRADEQYFLLISEKGQPMYEEVLPYVGRPVAVRGQLEKIDNWLVIRCQAEKQIERL